jgi:hypothetical protein
VERAMVAEASCAENEAQDRTVAEVDIARLQRAAEAQAAAVAKEEYLQQKCIIVFIIL